MGSLRSFVTKNALELLSVCDNIEFYDINPFGSNFFLHKLTGENVEVCIRDLIHYENISAETNKRYLGGRITNALAIKSV